MGKGTKRLKGEHTDSSPSRSSGDNHVVIAGGGGSKGGHGRGCGGTHGDGKNKKKKIKDLYFLFLRENNFWTL